MKKSISKSRTIVILTLFVLFCVFSGKAKAAGSVAINSTNFPDATFREYISENFDTNGDGSLSQIEIEDVWEIDVEEMSIGSLKGIEYFTSLEMLSCSENNLTSLNVSKCTSLSFLSCGSNQLTSINISGCSHLEYLLCDNNKLTALNVSGCPELGDLSCEENRLTSLDVSSCHDLWSLDCSDNELTTLNINGCIALEAIFCSGNELTSINVSGLSKMDYLSCAYNRLTSLDLSGCTRLKDLSCEENQLTSLNVSGCPNIEILDCSNNDLTSLNISGCTRLEALFCSSNELTSIDVRGFSVLEYLHCSFNNLTSLKVSGCTLLKHLDFSDNNIITISIKDCPCLIEAFVGGDHIIYGDYQNWSYDNPDNDEYYEISCDSSVVITTGEEKPVITTQPKNKSALVGTTASFTITASGTGLKYQWQWRTSSSGTWKNSSSTTTGYNTATLKVSATIARNGYQYRCKVTNSGGQSVYSNAATLYVLGIKTQPSSVNAIADNIAAFSIVATGNGKTYQWQYRTSSSGTWKNSSSATAGYNTSTLKVSATTARHGYQYRCRVKDSAGNTVYSNAATLYVLGIKTQPSSVSTTAGKTASFSVVATGNGKTYQWQYRSSSSGTWRNSTSATTGYNAATLKVSATTARHGYQYRCRVKDSAGNTVYSNAVTLRVLGIKTQPVSVSTSAGSTATFTVVATGTGKTYQWQYRASSTGAWQNCSSATAGYNTATLKVDAKTYRNGYQYRCKVVDSAGNVVYSKAATLTVK